jgi:DNA repair protein RadD
MKLRPYQQRALDELWAWFARNDGGNPIVEAAVGAGKSLMIAALAQRADAEFPGTRVLVLVHQKELLEQNVDKIVTIWPEANVGIYSAGAGRKDLGRQITYATIGSIWKHAHKLGRIDIVLADECFTGETLISTPSGNRRIDMLRCGDAVYNQCGIGIVESVFSKPVTDFYKLEFDDGTSLRCTGDHPIFTTKGWVAAKELENGAHLFSVEGMRVLWESVYPVDQEGRERKDLVSLSGADLEKARMLLAVVCKEAQEPNEQQSNAAASEGKTAGNQAQANQAWGQRAIAALATACAAARAGRGVGVRVSGQDNDAIRQRVSISLQDRHRQHHNDDRSRTGRWLSLLAGASQSGRSQDQTALFPRLVNISRVESRGSQAVFNLRVSGHPSYFANGKSVHNCHLINSKDTGMWRKFLSDLAIYCPSARTIGWTGTPFRGNGVWLTAGDEPLFTNVATRVTMRELLELNFLSPLVPATTVARIDTRDVRMSGDDYVVSELAKVTDKEDLVEATCDEIVQLAADRKRWLVFAVTIEHAKHVCEALERRGVSVDMVSANTPKAERAALIAAFRAGRLRCLVNVAVLTTGFDVPELDFIALLRATKSPVLYVQIAGRGMRLAPGKTDCLWADFTDTTALMGPVDAVKGRIATGGRKGEAPSKLCPECGSKTSAAATQCLDCGFMFPEPERIKHGAEASAAAVLSSQQEDLFRSCVVTDMRYRIHHKDGSPPSLRVEYYDGMLRVASEWCCLSHTGYARVKAEKWWMQRSTIDAIPRSAEEAVEWLEYSDAILRKPAAVLVTKNDKYPKIVSYHWQHDGGAT